MALLLTSYLGSACQSSAYVETTVAEGLLAKVVYQVDGQAFFLSDEATKQSSTEEGVTIVLPAETAGKEVRLYGLGTRYDTHCHKFYGDSNSSGVVDGGKIAAKCATWDCPEVYTFNFVSEFGAEYDEDRRIGTSETTLNFFYYCVNDDRIVFLDQSEIDTFDEQKTLKIKDDKLKEGDVIHREFFWRYDADFQYTSAGGTSKIDNYNFIYCGFYDHEEPVYEIIVNYENYKFFKELGLFGVIAVDILFLMQRFCDELLTVFNYLSDFFQNFAIGI